MKGLFGGFLLAAGILVAGGSGLCSLLILFGGGIGDMTIVLFFGGIPFALGVAAAYGGYLLIRSARIERDGDVTVE